MNDLAAIQTIRSQTLARIAEVTAAPKPTYDIGGQNVEWTEYLAQLQKTVDWCNQQEANNPDGDIGPVLIMSQGH